MMEEITMMRSLVDEKRRKELRRAAAAGLKIEFRRTKAELIEAPAQEAECAPREDGIFGSSINMDGDGFQPIFGPDRGVWRHSTSPLDAVHSEEREVVLSFPLGKVSVGGYDFHCTGTDGIGFILKIMRGEKVVGDIFLSPDIEKEVSDARSGAKITLFLKRTTQKGEFVVRINVEKNQ